MTGWVCRQNGSFFITWLPITRLLLAQSFYCQTSNFAHSHFDSAPSVNNNLQTKDWRLGNYLERHSNSTQEFWQSYKYIRQHWTISHQSQSVGKTSNVSVHVFKCRYCYFADPNHRSDTIQSLLPDTEGLFCISLLPFLAAAGFLTVPSISKAVAFSLWFMGQWGSVRCLCDKHKSVTKTVTKSQPIISNFSAQCSSTSFHKCLDVCKLKKIESHCSQSICILSIPLSSHPSPLASLTVMPFVLIFSFLLAAGDARLTDSPILLVLCPELCCLVCSVVVGMIHSVHHAFTRSS